MCNREMAIFKICRAFCNKYSVENVELNVGRTMVSGQAQCCNLLFTVIDSSIRRDGNSAHDPIGRL